MAFFPFLFNTIQKRANEKTNTRFWLPGVLQGIDNPDSSAGGKLLPLRGQNWPLGKIEGQAGQTITLSIIGAARSLVEPGQTVGPYMSDPYAALTVQNGEILGLDNLFLYPNPVTTESAEGYQTTIELKFNEYSDLGTLGLQGDYQLDQKIEVSGPAAGQKDVQTITGTGTFTSTITNAKLLAKVNLTVSGTGNKRAIDVDIESLELASVTEGGKPVFATKVLKINSVDKGYETIWLNMSNNAFNSPSASDAMLQSVTSTLNQSSNLKSLSDTMSSQLQGLLSSLTGNPAQLPNDNNQKLDNNVDLYLFDRIRAAMNDTSSTLYVPKQLVSINSPKLEPLNVDKIDVGTQDIGGLNWEPNILTNINVQGLANNLATADKMQLQVPVLTMQTTQGALKTAAERSVDGQVIPEAPLKLSADFSFSPPAGITPVTGNLVVNVSTSNLDIVATSSGTMLDNMVITFKSLTLVADLSSISIDINITSSSMMNSMAKTLVNKDSVKQQLVDQLNSQISSNLTSISQQVTQAVVQYGVNALDN